MSPPVANAAVLEPDSTVIAKNSLEIVEYAPISRFVADQQRAGADTKILYKGSPPGLLNNLPAPARVVEPAILNWVKEYQGDTNANVVVAVTYLPAGRDLHMIGGQDHKAFAVYADKDTAPQEINAAQKMLSSLNYGANEIQSAGRLEMDPNRGRLIVELVRITSNSAIQDNLTADADPQAKAVKHLKLDDKLTLAQLGLGMAGALSGGSARRMPRNYNKLTVIQGRKSDKASAKLSARQQDDLLAAVNKLHAAEQDPLKKLRLAELGGKIITGQLTLQNLREDATLQSQPLLAKKIGNFEKSSLLDDAIERLTAKAAVDPAYTEALTLLKAAAIAATAADEIPQLLVDLAVELETASTIELPVRAAALQEQLREAGAVGTAKTGSLASDELTPTNPDSAIDTVALETPTTASLQARLDVALADSLDPEALANIMLAVQQAAQLGVVQELNLSGLHTALSERDMDASLLPTALADGGLSPVKPAALADLLKKLSSPDVASNGRSAVLLQQIDDIAGDLREFASVSRAQQPDRVMEPAVADAAPVLSMQSLQPAAADVTIDVIEPVGLSPAIMRQLDELAVARGLTETAQPPLPAALQTELRALAQDAGLTLSPTDITGNMTAGRVAELVTALQDNSTLADNPAFQSLVKQIEQLQTQPTANENMAPQAARESISLKNDISHSGVADKAPFGMATDATKLADAQMAAATTPAEAKFDVSNILEASKSRSLNSAELALLKQQSGNPAVNKLLRDMGYIIDEPTAATTVPSAPTATMTSADPMADFAANKISMKEAIDALMKKGSWNSAERELLIKSGALKEDVSVTTAPSIVKDIQTLQSNRAETINLNRPEIVNIKHEVNILKSPQSQISANDNMQTQNYVAPTVDLKRDEIIPTHGPNPRYDDVLKWRHDGPSILPEKGPCGGNCRTCDTPCGLKDMLGSDERKENMRNAAETVIIVNESSNFLKSGMDVLISTHATPANSAHELPKSVSDALSQYNMPTNLIGTLSPGGLGSWAEISRQKRLSWKT